jgi:hypothetical protein
VPPVQAQQHLVYRVSRTRLHNTSITISVQRHARLLLMPMQLLLLVIHASLRVLSVLLSQAATPV